MPIGGTKTGLFGAGSGVGNYFGDETLGDCQFGASAVTQSGDSTAIDTVLSTGSESGGPGSSSYGDDVPYSSAIYETTVLNTSGTYDGDMWVGNFTNLTIDASVTLSTDRPCRGMLIYCSGNAVINGSLSMTARGGHSDPTASGGGTPSSAVDTNGLRLPLLGGPDGSETLAAANFAGAGTAAIAAVANHEGISSDGTIFRINKLGATGAPGGPPGGSAPTAPTGAKTIGTGGGASGRGNDGDGATGTGGDGGAFSGGASSGSCRHASSGAGGDYGGAGSAGAAGSSGEGVAGGVGNPGAGGYGSSGGVKSGVGGIIWLVVKGNITVGASGSVQARGSGGPTANYYGGSGSGGGALMICYAGTLTNNGSISTNGGSGGGGIHGGHIGGHGGHFTAQVDN